MPFKKKMKLRKKKRETEEAAASSSQLVNCPNYYIEIKLDYLTAHMKSGCEPSMQPGRLCLVDRTPSSEKKLYVCGDCFLTHVSFLTQAELSAHKASRHGKI